MHLRNRVQKVVKKVIWKHRYDKSSWSVYSLLKSLNNLNNHLEKGDIAIVWSMLTPFTKQKKSFHGSNLTEAIEEVKKTQGGTNLSPKDGKEGQILAKYINRGVESNRLPHHIPEIYKKELLLPMALHEKAILQLSRIQHQLSKGPPPVVLSHTSAGPSRIWFVRSALNKGKRQSKALGVLLRREKRKAQKTLDDLEDCKQNAQWALDEAIWEQMVEDGICLDWDLGKSLSSLTSLGQNGRSNRNAYSKHTPTKLKEWLGPVKEAMDLLIARQRERVHYYKEFKDSLLLNGGQFNFLEGESHKMHIRRVERFQALVRKELPYVVPFMRGRDLPSLLNKYKF